MKLALRAVMGLVLVASCGAAFGEAPVKVGFAGSAVAGRMSAKDQGRIEGAALQDLMGMMQGRYTFAKDDNVSGTWGLDAIWGRVKSGPKPYEKLRENDGGQQRMQSERVIFADPGTGASMMMLSQIPDDKDGPADELNYYGKACWSADGGLIVYQRSKKPSLWGPDAQVVTEDFGPLVLNGDGSCPRIVGQRGMVMRSPICSPLRPEVGYTVIGTELVTVNLKTGAVEKKLGAVPRFWWLKMSPDDKYVMGKSPDGFWVIATADGKRWNVKIDQNPKTPGRSYAVHDSYRFVPGNTDLIMYWYETSHPGGGMRTNGFRIQNFKTGKVTVCPVVFDWNHGDVGRYLGFHTEGYITPWDGKTFGAIEGLVWPEKKFRDFGPFYSEPVDFGGYAAHWPDDQRWAYMLNYVEGKSPYLSEVSKVFVKPLAEGGRVNRAKVCTMNLQGGTDHWGEKSIALVRPNISPDGTKILFNANAFNRDGVYMVVCKLPEAPTGVKAVETGAKVKVSWVAPNYHKEIAGYEVWRSPRSGEGYSLATPQLVTGNSIELPALDSMTYLVVRSVERSGLRSGLSEEVIAGQTGELPARVFCEAESGIRADLQAPSPDAMWVGFDGLASNLNFLWQRRKDKAGSVKVEVNVPRDGAYFVVARMKGKEGAVFTVGGAKVEVPATNGWKWETSDQAVKLKAGPQAVEIGSGKYGSCMDCFYLATDKDFSPTERIVVAASAALSDLKGTATKEGFVKLTWSGVKSPRWSHYNVYCAAKAGVESDRKTLVASPDEAKWLDWQAGPGTHYYRVTQVTLDGVESKPSAEVEVMTQHE